MLINLANGRGLRCCFGMRRFSVGHVGLSYRLHVRFGRRVGDGVFGSFFRQFCEFVDQCKLGRGFARYRGLFVVGYRLLRDWRGWLRRRLGLSRFRCGRCGRFVPRGQGCARRDQGDKADIGAGTDALQHQMADADRRLDAALRQGIAARCVKARLGQIAKREQRSRGITGADEHAVARKGCDRRVDTFDQALQSLQ